MICTAHQILFKLWYDEREACGKFGGRTDVHMGLWWGNGKERNHLEDLGMDGRVMLKWILRNVMVMRVLNLAGSGQGQVLGCCEHGYEPWSSIKCGNF